MGTQGAPIRTRRTGSFGAISSDAATPLAMVFTELVQNAVEHAFDADTPGLIEIDCRRSGAGLVLCVQDDGVGMPADFDLGRSASLGLSIVQTLVGELSGTLILAAREDGPGTRAIVTIPDVAQRR